MKISARERRAATPCVAVRIFNYFLIPYHPKRGVRSVDAHHVFMERVKNLAGRIVSGCPGPTRAILKPPDPTRLDP